MVWRAGSKEGWRVRKYAVVQPIIPPPIITMFFRSLVVDIASNNKDGRFYNIFGITIQTQMFQDGYLMQCTVYSTIQLRDLVSAGSDLFLSRRLVLPPSSSDYTFPFELSRYTCATLHETNAFQLLIHVDLNFKTTLLFSLL